MKNHPLHKIIGEEVKEAIGGSRSEVVLDLACGGGQYLPIFFQLPKSSSNKYCNVDCLVLLNNKIKIIIEIEEANMKPTQICGKFLTSALGKYFTHSNVGNYAMIGMDESVCFIQIIDASKLPKATSKIDQFENIEKSINSILPLKGSNIRSYKIIPFRNVNNTDDMNKFREYVIGLFRKKEDD